VADAGQLGHLPERERLRAPSGQELFARGQQGLTEIAVVVLIIALSKDSGSGHVDTENMYAYVDAVIMGPGGASRKVRNRRAMSPATAATPLAADPGVPLDWRGAFRDLPREHGFEPLRLEGELPPDLRGTLYRNGPSLFSSHGEPYRHWFDGDGAVSAVRFSREGAQGAVRVVQSAGLIEERAAGRRLHGSYGTPPNGNLFQRLRRIGGKNNANTSVIVWQNRLFALMEGGRPTELSPADLSTVGETDLDGVVLQTFSAHPHRIPQRKASYNFGVRLGRDPMLDLFELPDAGAPRRLGSVRLAGATMIHDFIATPSHLVFFAPPLRLRLLRLLLGRKSYGDSLEWSPGEGTEVIVVPIDAPEHSTRFTVEPFYQWHFSNAFDRGPSELVVDYVRLPDFSSHAWLARIPRGELTTAWEGRYHRATLDLTAKTFRSEERWSTPCEFPRIASRAIGAEHRYAYLGSTSTGSRAGFFDQISKLDLATGAALSFELGPGHYPGEPVFVRKSDARGEDDGYLLTLVYDAPSDTSHIAVHDAAHPSAPILARVHYDHRLPPTFHGNFVHTAQAT
jgi:carotenoid cleavage dioxygenase-like enzyme